MPRYIDAEKLAERINASPAFKNADDGSLLLNVVLDIISKFPEADVVPRGLYEEEKLRRESLEGYISSEERWCGMNHDATHCADYTKDCPKSCFRAQLTEDLRKIHYPLPTSWARFKGTKECPKAKKGGE